MFDAGDPFRLSELFKELRYFQGDRKKSYFQYSRAVLGMHGESLEGTMWSSHVGG